MGEYKNQGNKEDYIRPDVWLDNHRDATRYRYIYWKHTVTVQKRFAL
jgi:hypothetical protein